MWFGVSSRAGPISGTGSPSPGGRIVLRQAVVPRRLSFELLVLARLLGIDLGLDGPDLGLVRFPIRLLAGPPLLDDRLPLARCHPLALELHVTLGAIALLLGDPPPVERHPAERAVGFLVVRQDLDHLGVRLPRLARQALILRPPRELPPRLGVAGGDGRSSLPIILEGGHALFDADDARHRRGQNAPTDVHCNRVLRALDDLARESAAALQVDVVRESRNGRQSDDDDCSLHSRFLLPT